MQFTPKSENEIASENLWPVGVYDFEIIEAEEAISKSSGADMIKLNVKIMNPDGESRRVFDYLLESAAYKLRHCAEVCGLLNDYERGTLDATDFIGKVGRCKVSIQKDKTGQYADRNGIADYVVEDASQIATPPRAPITQPPSRRRTPEPAPAGDIDDEIPF